MTDIIPIRLKNVKAGAIQRMTFGNHGNDAGNRLG